MSLGIPLQAGIGLNDSIAGFLAGLGIPDAVASLLGQALAFLIVFAVVFIIGRSVLMPIANRAMDSRGLVSHAQRPLRRLIVVIVGFAAVTAAFGAAGYPNFLQSLATIAAAATLAMSGLKLWWLREIVQQYDKRGPE